MPGQAPLARAEIDLALAQAVKMSDRPGGVPGRHVVCSSILEWRSDNDGLGRTRTGHTVKSA